MGYPKAFYKHISKAKANAFKYLRSGPNSYKEFPMRGSVSWQVREVFSSIAHIGESRHDAKSTARTGKPLTASQLAERTGIYSYATLDSYRSVAADCFEYAKTNFSVKDISKITSKHVSAFLRDKVENGASYNTVKTYSAALGKLETALNSYFQTKEYDFKMSISEMMATIEKPEAESRAFRDARAVISSMTEPSHRFVATLQYEHGLRIAEASYIDVDTQLDGNSFTVQGKGGYMITKELSSELVNELYGLTKDNIFRELDICAWIGIYDIILNRIIILSSDSKLSLL